MPFPKVNCLCHCQFLLRLGGNDLYWKGRPAIEKTFSSCGAAERKQPGNTGTVSKGFLGGQRLVLFGGLVLTCPEECNGLKYISKLGAGFLC